VATFKKVKSISPYVETVVWFATRVLALLAI